MIPSPGVMYTTGNFSNRFLKRFSQSAGGVLFALLLLVFAAGSHASGLQRVGVVLSMEIHPYLQTVEGIHSRLTAHMESIGVFLIEDTGNKYLDALESKISGLQPDILIAVGPEAAQFLWVHYREPVPKKVFTMVLNPTAILPRDFEACGISLNIPIGDQLAGIAASLPGLKAIGLIYDPDHNGDFSLEAIAAGKRMGIEVVPLAVHDRKTIPDVLKNNWLNIQGLWMIPDQTVITESLVRYIVKEAIVNGVAVIGYNRYFYQSGAALSFVLDYADIGAQTAEMAIRMASGMSCQIEPPRFSFMVNRAVLDMLGIGDATRGPDSGRLRKRSP